MRYWIYCEPVSETSSTPVYQIFSDQAILDTYWDYWCKRMCEVGRESQISENNCITDWTTIHWAVPATAETLAEMFGAPKAE